MINHGLRFLAALAVSGVNKVPLVRCAGAVAACVTQPATGVDTCRWATRFLANLAACADNERVLMAWLDTVLQCVARHGDDVPVVAQALRFVMNVAANVDNTPRLMATVPVVKGALCQAQTTHHPVFHRARKTFHPSRPSTVGFPSIRPPRRP